MRPSDRNIESKSLTNPVDHEVEYPESSRSWTVSRSIIFSIDPQRYQLITGGKYSLINA